MGPYCRGALGEFSPTSFASWKRDWSIPCNAAICGFPILTRSSASRRMRAQHLCMIPNARYAMYPSTVAGLSVYGKNS